MLSCALLYVVGWLARNSCQTERGARSRVRGSNIWFAFRSCTKMTPSAAEPVIVFSNCCSGNRDWLHRHAVGQMREQKYKYSIGGWYPRPLGIVDGLQQPRMQRFSTGDFSPCSCRGVLVHVWCYEHLVQPIWNTIWVLRLILAWIIETFSYSCFSPFVIHLE